jgi:hypothetical protein
MRILAISAALAMSATLACGCATVSVVGVAGEVATDVEAASATPAQLQLRTASAEFAVHAAEAGWSDPEAAGEMAREAIDVLLHGRTAEGETVAAEADPAERFIEARAYDVAPPEDVAASLAAEVREARVLVRAVNTAAAQVVLGPERPSWARREDVRAAESVVQIARRVRGLFRQVGDQVGDRLSRGDRDLLRREIEAFDDELSQLSAAADALSGARGDVQFREVETLAQPVG